ncbi:hypothetical protein CLF_110867 [Clonorchis sinensis]|uniref:Uncharacterized protein n=1 Tax=Clonorchis sinensis TaxID=79923 RepID=G7YU04_CLOSI|nr:hypothetical protein CLF_110867 [Clonorchis sinensis]
MKIRIRDTTTGSEFNSLLAMAVSSGLPDNICDTKSRRVSMRPRALGVIQELRKNSLPKPTITGFELLATSFASFFILSCEVFLTRFLARGAKFWLFGRQS